jgi:FdhD protein
MSTGDSGGPPQATREVQGRRISTSGSGESPVGETVGVVVEAPLTVDVQGVESYTLLRTPGDDRALAAGFLLSEGIVDGLDDVESLRECEEDAAMMRVRLKRRVPRIHDAGRNLLIVSSCGLCGAEDLAEKLRSIPRVPDTLRVEGRILRVVGEALRRHQPLFETCGGTHAAGLFDARGDLVSTAEDAGRHNALDKAIGGRLLGGEPTAGLGAVLSGRVSLEMVGKAARAGIELVSAISAPTSLAIEVAESCGITLCSFVRETRATVFTHPHRVQGAG